MSKDSSLMKKFSTLISSGKRDASFSPGGQRGQSGEMDDRSFVAHGMRFHYGEEFRRSPVDLVMKLDATELSKVQSIGVGQVCELALQESRSDPRLVALVNDLVNWMNTSLSPDRVVVRDFEDDLCDGQVLALLLKRLDKECNLDLPDVCLSPAMQQRKLAMILNYVNDVVMPRPPLRNGIDSAGEVTLGQRLWDVDSISSKCLESTLHLMIALYDRLPPAKKPLPENVSLKKLLFVRAKDGADLKLLERQITGQTAERDAFDTLFEHAPDKLAQLEQNLLRFINIWLSQFTVSDMKFLTPNVTASDFRRDFGDGLRLILLLSTLGGYAVPPSQFHVAPLSPEQRLANVQLALNLLMDVVPASDGPQTKYRADQIEAGDEKATVRLLYAIYERFRHTMPRAPVKQGATNGGPSTSSQIVV